MKVFDKKQSTAIVLCGNPTAEIRLAVKDLQQNLRDLSGLQEGFEVLEAECGPAAALAESAIYVQTVPGKMTEAYEVCVNDKNVVITGADMLGTIYGVYAFATKCLGISPTYRVTDVFPDQTEELELPPQTIYAPERAVRFRGWFINDEDLLSEFKISGGKRVIDYPFYQDVMDTEVLDMILETALRLEMNLIIPASFLNIGNPDEEMLVKAVYRRGLYISQHHIEPLGVSYFTAQDYIKKYGDESEAVSFIQNRPRMEEIWRYYAKKWAVYGDRVVWQLGLRGKADQAVWEADPSVPMSMETRGGIITDAIQTQYDIIRETLGTEAFHSTATLWNEGSGLFGGGHLRIPANTIIVFADFGLDQMLGDDFYTTKCEVDRKCGIYYHAAYWTLGPHLTEGCVPEKMAYNYRHAAELGKLHYSILNVSNVRPIHVSVSMNAEILKNPLMFDAEQEVLKYDCAVFGETGPKVNALRKEYYRSFADYKEASLKAKMDSWSFYYRPYKDISFIRNPATDGQVTWYGRKLLLGCILEDRLSPKDDIPEMKASAEKFKALYEKMEALEAEIPAKALPYYRQFLKYQTRHMYLITEWAITCEALMDEKRTNADRIAQGSYGASCLELLLEERKVLEEGKWEQWHRGDKKMDFRTLLAWTRKQISELDA